MKQKTKKKEIYYYKPVLEKYSKESNGFKIIENTAKEFNNIFEKIESLSLDKDDKENVYVVKDANTYHYILVNFKNKDYIYGMLITSSNDIYPSIEQEGNIIPLKNKIPSNGNLADITHFVFFLQEDIVGIEYNNKGARPNSIANYINEKLYGIYRLELIESINSNTLEKLEKTKKIKELDIKLDTKSILTQQAEKGELFEALNAANKIAKDSFVDDELTIAITIKSKYGFKITDGIKENLKKLVINKDKEEGIRRQKEKIKIKSQSEEDENFDFDLVRQIMKASKIPIKVNSNSMIDSNDMFRNIVENYEKYK